MQEASRGDTGGEDRAAAVYRFQPGVEHEYRERSCARCPWRTDADLTAFSEQDMDMLRRANGGPGAETPLDAPVAGCHLDQPDTAHPFRWCAGWLATVGENHLAIRLAIAFEALPGHAVTGQLAPPVRQFGGTPRSAYRTAAAARFCAPVTHRHSAGMLPAV